MSNIRLFMLSGFLALVGCGRQSEAVPIDRGNALPIAEKVPGVGKTKGPILVAQKEEAPNRAQKKVAAEESQEKAETAGDGFTFARDKGGKLLEKMLSPQVKVPAWPGPSGPKQIKAPQNLERPETPLPVFQGLPARPGLKIQVKPARPYPVPEELPLYGNRGEPKTPEDAHLPVEPLTHWQSPDLAKPADLPILATPRLERAPLADPTLESSTDAALAGIVPMRMTPAPFLRLSLPDPFENRQTIRLRTTPSEDPTPHVAGPRPSGN